MVKNKIEISVSQCNMFSHGSDDAAEIWGTNLILAEYLGPNGKTQPEAANFIVSKKDQSQNCEQIKTEH